MSHAHASTGRPAGAPSAVGDPGRRVRRLLGLVPDRHVDLRQRRVRAWRPRPPRAPPTERAERIGDQRPAAEPRGRLGAAEPARPARPRARTPTGSETGGCTRGAYATAPVGLRSVSRGEEAAWRRRIRPGRPRRRPGRRATEERQPHGGLLVARRLKAHGVTKLFTLSGGHLFSVYDGCRTEGIDLIDMRHESAAAFAAEGWAKVTREPGVCALTAGPGVTNGMSAIASAHKNNSPMVVLGGRAPQMRWGQGSLQEIDHVPFVRAAHQERAHRDVDRPRSRGLVDEALATALHAAAPARRSSTCRSTSSSWRPTTRELPAALPDPAALPAADGDAIERAAALLAGRRAPGDHGRHRPLLGPRRAGAARALRGARHPGVPERARARLPAGRPPELLLARARRRPQGRRRRARDRRADGLPARLRRHRFGEETADRADRAGRARARAARASSRASCTAACRRRSRRCARRRSRPAAPPERTARWRDDAARDRGREARRRARRS